MCESAYCFYPYLPVGQITQIALVVLSGLVVWKLIRAVISLIPGIG